MEQDVQNEGLIRLDGGVEQIVYRNEENGYTVCDVGVDASGDQAEDVITAVGILPYVGEGDTLTLWGNWVHTPKYGRQFKVVQYEKKLPTDATSILRYLSSRTIKGIGPKLAQRIVDEFGEDTLDVLEHHPDWLAQIPGISMKKAKEMSEDFKAKEGIRSAMMFFRDFFGAALTVRIYKKWGGSAVDIAKQNPYRLCEEIDGVGFERADRMAMKLGLEQDDMERLKAGVVYFLTYHAAQNGHVCLPLSKLVAGASALLQVQESAIEETVDALLCEKRLCIRSFEDLDEPLIYCHREDECEQYIADKLTILDKLCPRVEAMDVEAFIQKEERLTGIAYASQQKKAIYGALESGVLLLTGGPGTGKTTVVRALLDIFSNMDMDVALAAPTGRAANRLSESTVREAKTIHRLLEMEFDEGVGGHGRFRRNEKELLDEQVIVVDEVSMVDNGLMCALLKAVKPGARVILIGDADQLPSVGAGRVFNDLLESGQFCTVRLDEVFRQAKESLIVTNAHAVNRGEMPTVTVKDNDFFFLPRQYDREIAQTVVELYQSRLPRAYGEATQNGIQVIAPSRKGEAGTEQLNRLLQAALNPATPSKREYRSHDTVFREGDRVMQIKNNYDLEWESEEEIGSGVFNGDIGVIQRIAVGDNEVEVSFDGRRVVYDLTMLDELEHAWAVTVHKSQGSEYPFVIIPLYASSPLLLNRNLFYTAITRAKRMVILVGRQDVIRTMVEREYPSMRYTGLCRRLRKP